MNTIFDQIIVERDRQNKLWGVQNHHPLKWFSIAGEEFGEMMKAFNEYDDELNSPGPDGDQLMKHYENMKEEAIHTIAVLVQMLECLERMEHGSMMP